MKDNRIAPSPSIDSENTPHHFILCVILCAVFALSGCATPALMKEAEGQIKSRDRLVVNKITNAYKDNDTVFICMNVYDIDAHIYDEMTLSVPLRERRRLDIHFPLSDNEPTADIGQLPQSSLGAYVGFTPNPEDLTHGCQARGLKLQIFNLSTVVSPYDSSGNQGKSSFKLSNGITEAVYVISNKYTPLNFGYVSTNPIVKNAYSVDIASENFTDMRTMENTKHYLYILTPITVAIDTAVTAVTVAVFSVLDPRRYGRENINNLVIDQ